MPAEFTMPQMSDTMTEGTVVKWRKKEGDKITAGDILAEIETDKAVMESEAFESGTLAVILAKEGEKVKVGALLAVIATPGDKPDELKKKYATAAGAKPSGPAPAQTEPKPAPKAAASTAPPAPSSRPCSRPASSARLSAGRSIAWTSRSS